jgi:hypothetical protein
MICLENIWKHTNVQIKHKNRRIHAEKEKRGIIQLDGGFFLIRQMI